MLLANEVRPHRFDDVVGQKSIVENIRMQSVKNKFFQAYTLCGQFGSGKTTIARIIQKAVNCKHKDENGNPCLKCESCKTIMRGTATDVVEIDAASNTGVDNIRALKDEVQYLPSVLDKKVYIIDEVQRLSTGAFDALLKVLEEPPAHVIFILCTTEKNKIPKTILSRTAVYNFGCISTEDIAAHLERVAKEHSIPADKDALNLIAKNSQGAMRNALSLLEQISNAGDVTEKAVADMLGIAESSKIYSLLFSLLAKDRKECIFRIMELLDGGAEPYSMISDMLDMLSDCLVNSYGVNSTNGTKEYAERVTGLVERYKPSDFSATIKALLDLKSQIRICPDRSTIICGLVSFLTPSSDSRIVELENRILQLEKGCIISEMHENQDSLFSSKGNDYVEEPEYMCIYGQKCIRADEWKSGSEHYLLGCSVEDSDFFYAEVNGVAIEYDHKPDRAEVEEDYLNEMAAREIDRHEAEVFEQIEGADYNLADSSEQNVSAGLMEEINDSGKQDDSVKGLDNLSGTTGESMVREKQEKTKHIVEGVFQKAKTEKQSHEMKGNSETKESCLPVGTCVLLDGRRFTIKEYYYKKTGNEVCLQDLTFLKENGYPISNIVNMEYFFKYAKVEESEEEQKLEVQVSESPLEEFQESHEELVFTSEPEISADATGFEMLSMFGFCDTEPLESSPSKSEKLSDEEEQLKKELSQNPILENIVELSCRKETDQNGLKVICEESVDEPMGRILNAYAEAGKISVPVAFA